LRNSRMVLSIWVSLCSYNRYWQNWFND